MQVLRLLVSVTAVLVASSVHAEVSVSSSDCEETKSLDQLYQDAIKEGGKLVVYHGGDTPTQQDDVTAAFCKAFPKVNLTMVVDYSKFHDVRVDNQLETSSLVPDVVALQTLQDYPRWKRQGKLLNYKPAGFSKLYQNFVDPDGAWISHTAKGLADPIYADHIASSYPHDDDAALFVYAQYIEKYGWKWLEKLVANRVQFKRSSDSAAEAVATKQKAIGMAGGSPFGVATVKVVEGRGAGTPYLAWGQRMAILKKSKRPAAAKLFLNWIISKDVQTTVLGGINSRTDVNVTGSPQAWDVPEASVAKFPVFMEDRANVERLKATMALYFGEVQGKPSAGELGLYPGL